MVRRRNTSQSWSSRDNVLITNWYNAGLNTVNTAASIERITVTAGVAADDELLTSNVQALVDAMAAVSSTLPVTTTLTTEQRATLATQLAASWT